MTKLLLSLVVLTLATSGCIQNMGDLKDRLGGDDEPVTPAALETTPDTATNATTTNVTATQPPVARISVFAANGALLFKSTFTAEDPTAIVFAEEKSKISLIAGDSEAVERGATLANFAWTLNAKPIEGGRQATFETGEPGMYVVGLVVTDSNGRSDNQTVTLGVAPTPYEVVTELVTGPVAGAEGTGESAALPWELAAPEKPALVQSVKIVASPDVQCDAILDLLDAEGGSLGHADSAGHQDLDQTEVIELGALPYASYTIAVSPYACAEDEIPVTITVVFLPIVEGFGGDDGHGHAH